MAPDSSAPLRVLYLNHVGKISGAENSLLSLLRHLDRQRIVPLAAVPHGRLLAAVHALDVKVAWLPETRLRRTLNPVSLLRQYRTLRAVRATVERLVSEWRIDLIHANSVPAALALGLSGRPLPPRIWHCRDLLISERVIRWLARRCEHIVAISKVVRRHLLEIIPQQASQITVIYNGISPADFTPEAPAHRVKAELGLAANARVVATVGQLVPWKRHDLFIEAAQIVSQHCPEVRFWIIGADMFGEHRLYVDYLEELAPPSVSFLGYRRDIADLVNAADVIAHSSTCEPFGRAILEAISLGKPCVAPRAGGLAELIEDNRSGLLVEPANAAALAEGIIRLLNDQELARRLGETARQRALTDFSAQTTAAQMQQLYEELSGGKQA